MIQNRWVAVGLTISLLHDSVKPQKTAVCILFPTWFMFNIIYQL